MSLLDGLRYRAAILRRALFDRRAYRDELNAELDFHLDLETMHQRHEGASDDDATRAARRARRAIADGALDADA